MNLTVIVVGTHLAFMMLQGPDHQFVVDGPPVLIEPVHEEGLSGGIHFKGPLTLRVLFVISFHFRRIEAYRYKFKSIIYEGRCSLFSMGLDLGNSAFLIYHQINCTPRFRYPCEEISGLLYRPAIVKYPSLGHVKHHSWSRVYKACRS